MFVRGLGNTQVPKHQERYTRFEQTTSLLLSFTTLGFQLIDEIFKHQTILIFHIRYAVATKGNTTEISQANSGQLISTDNERTQERTA